MTYTGEAISDSLAALRPAAESTTAEEPGPFLLKHEYPTNENTPSLLVQMHRAKLVQRAVSMIAAAHACNLSGLAQSGNRGTYVMLLPQDGVH